MARIKKAGEILNRSGVQATGQAVRRACGAGWAQRSLRKVLSLLTAGAVTLSLAFSAAVPVYADNRRDELEAEKKAAQAELDKIYEQQKQNEEVKANAEELKAQFEQQQGLILSQISTLTEQMAYIEDQINTKETEIEAKQLEIEQKQAEYDARWAGFKERMRAMQKLNDGGAIALLSSATNLYQLLTFAKTLEQISSKDQQICDDLENQRIELDNEKANLEEMKAALEADRADLQDQTNQLNGKKAELSASIQKQDATISEADANEKALELAAAEARARVDEAAKELDEYLNSQVKQYSDAAITCSLNFGPALPTYTYISCVFGTGGHRGTDFAAPANTPIYAVGDGIVTTAGWHYSWGYYVQVYHGKDDQGNTYATLYAHMIQSPSVSAGQSVSKGTTLGYVGSTGNSTGNHLHLEMKINGALVNSAAYVPH